MIRIYHADVRPIAKQYSVSQLLALLPVSLHKRALKYRFDHSRYSFIVGRLMLQGVLRERDLDIGLLEQLKYNAFGKPLLKDFVFNISHSAHWVVCAFSSGCELGIDVEVPDPTLDIHDLKSFFTPSEWLDIRDAADPTARLYQYWTAKESILKAEGSGVARLKDIRLEPFKRARLSGDDKIWYLKPLSLQSGVYCCACTDRVDEIYNLVKFWPH